MTASLFALSKGASCFLFLQKKQFIIIIIFMTDKLNRQFRQGLACQILAEAIKNVMPKVQAQISKAK